jgi:hypothetical protein
MQSDKASAPLTDPPKKSDSTSQDPPSRLEAHKDSTTNTMTYTEDSISSSRVTLAEVLQATQAVTSRFGDEYFGKLDKEEAYPHDYVKAH